MVSQFKRHGRASLVATSTKESAMRELKTEELKQVSGAGKPCTKGNNGFGNGGSDGVPGRTGKQDETR